MANNMNFRRNVNMSSARPFDPCAPKAVLNGRYVVVEECGNGSFCTALRCWDMARNDYAVVKVMKTHKHSKRSIMKAVGREVSLLADIQQHEAATGVSSGCLQVLETFEQQGYIAVAMEPLGMSYVDILRINGYSSLPLPLVKQVMRQVLHSLAFLHGMGVVHLDLKPHNILAESPEMATGSALCSDGRVRNQTLPRSSAARLIDFGGSRYASDQESEYNFTTEFRSPEVILDLDTTPAADMWSFGTVLIQLYTGRLLFGRLNPERSLGDLEQLRMMQVVTGEELPPAMALLAKQYSPEMLKRVVTVKGRLYRCAAVEKAVAAAAPCVQPLAARVSAEDGALLDLLQRCLRFRPEERITAAEALNHPFFTAVQPAAAAASAPNNVPSRLPSALPGALQLLQPALATEMAIGPATGMATATPPSAGLLPDIHSPAAGVPAVPEVAAVVVVSR